MPDCRGGQPALIIAAIMADSQRVLSDNSPSLSVQEAGIFSSARDLLVSLRPKQWTKNFLVYMALLFSVGEAWRVSDGGSGRRPGRR